MMLTMVRAELVKNVPSSQAPLVSRKAVMLTWGHKEENRRSFTAATSNSGWSSRAW